MLSYRRNKFGGPRSERAAAARASAPFAARASAPFAARPFASESRRKIRLIKNAVTGDIEEDTYGNDTVFSGYKESDFLAIGKLIEYGNSNPANPPPGGPPPQGSGGLQIVVLQADSNADVFSTLMQYYLRTPNVAAPALPAIYVQKPLPGNPFIPFGLELDDFKSYNVGGYLIKVNQDFTKYVKDLGASLGHLRTYGKSIGMIDKNLMYMKRINASGIQLDEVCARLSEEFSAISGNRRKRNQLHYTRWRNDMIQDTVQGLNLRKVNRDFIAFILFNIFALCFDDIDIEDITDVQLDGRKRRRSKSRSRKSRKSKSKSRSRKSRKSDGKRKSRRSRRSRKSRKSDGKSRSVKSDGKRRKSRKSRKSDDGKRRKRRSKKSRSKRMSLKKIQKMLSKM